MPSPFSLIPPGWQAFALAVAVVVVTAAPDIASAQARAATVAAEGVPWSSLTPNQKSALQPLQRDWDSIEATRKGKWLEIANKLPSMPPEERARVQARMADWARLTPRERGQARMNFKEAQELSPQERRARWEAYNALPPDQRQRLADRAAPAPASQQPARKATPSDEAARSAKSNVVPNSSYAPRPKAIAPTVAQAQPGATTNLITKRPSPPAHQQTGLPKIAASPGFVDQATLLPKRGPQGAATRSAAASTPPVPRP
jgi:hypothetical protein